MQDRELQYNTLFILFKQVGTFFRGRGVKEEVIERFLSENISTVPRPISGQYQFQDSSNLFLFFSCENGSIIEPILSGESATIYDYIPSFFLVCCCFPKSYCRLRQGESKFFLEKRALYRAVNLFSNYIFKTIFLNFKY